MQQLNATMLPRLCTYVSVSILCLALCRCGVAGPVGARESPLSLSGTTCNALARSLLWNVSAVLAMCKISALNIIRYGFGHHKWMSPQIALYLRDHLFSGFDCTQQNAKVHLRTQTVATCTPQNANCAHSTVLNIDENECLKRILEDLLYYRKTFQAYLNPELTKTVVRSIDDLMENCFSVSAMDNSPAEVPMDHQNSFQERLKLCKVLKGFNLRTITINRVFNYILAK